MRRLALIAGVVLLLTTAFGVASARESESGFTAARTGPLAGVTGNHDRFQSQTGQDSTVLERFFHWGQGVTYGDPFAKFFPSLAPIPMIHLSTTGSDGTKEIITPGDIAAGRGDSYLIALNEGIARWGRGIYIRPLGEMNNYQNPYAAYNQAGTPRDAAHSTAAYKKAFARIYLILHGGPLSAINAKLRALGMPPVTGPDLLVNPFPKLRVIWSPLAGGVPRVGGNAPEAYYPGPAYVDVEGGDIYDESLRDNAPWPDLEALYKLALSHRKTFSIPEWGLIGIDDAAFVDHMCSFLRDHRATEMQAFTEGVPGSRYDLASKPSSRAAYRRCVTPLAGSLPGWATGTVAKQIALSVTPDVPSGPSPLSVRFAIVARLNVPVEHWQLLFGDGTQIGADGPPPARTAPHIYGQDGIYNPTLVVYPAPPFKLEAAQFLASATVTAGNAIKPVVGFTVTPTTGSAPLKAVFRLLLDLPVPVESWEIAYGDGVVGSNDGAPSSHFAGYTYKTAGSFRAILILNGSQSRQFVSYTDITVTGGSSGKPPPATSTVTGTVRVNGKPFTGGIIQYGSKVDVTGGTVTLKTDLGKLTAYGAGLFAQFVLLRGAESGKPIVELRLTGGNFQACKTGRHSASFGNRRPPKYVRGLWAQSKGGARTRGKNLVASVGSSLPTRRRYLSANGRLAAWLTADRCDGTLATVKHGSVVVTDLVHKKKIVLRAGQSYLAKRP
jgi:PKD repeat protein